MEMIKKRISKLPDFIKNSQYIQNMELENEKYVEFSKKTYEKAYKENTEINNAEDYEKMLFCIDFFDFPVPETVEIFENDPKNEKDVFRVLSSNENHIFNDRFMLLRNKIENKYLPKIDLEMFVTEDDPSINADFNISTSFNEEISIDFTINDRCKNILKMMQKIKDWNEKNKEFDVSFEDPDFSKTVLISGAEGVLNIECTINDMIPVTYDFDKGSILCDNFMFQINEIHLNLEKFLFLFKEKKNYGFIDKEGFFAIYFYKKGKYKYQFYHNIKKNNFTDKSFKEIDINHLLIENYLEDVNYVYNYLHSRNLIIYKLQSS